MTAPPTTYFDGPSSSTDDHSVECTTVPHTTIDSGPTGLTDNNDPSFTFSSSKTGSDVRMPPRRPRSGDRRIRLLRQPPEGPDEPVKCRLCEGAMLTASAVCVRERMYGTGEVFEYCRCSLCGSQLLRSIPDDLSPYYPESYYSLDTWEAPNPRSPAVRLRRMRLAVVLQLPIPIADSLGVRRLIPHYVRWFAGFGARPRTSILEVGSGGGHLLANMAVQGFSNLLGIDRFMQRERPAGPVRLLRTSLDRLDETFDVVMINHTLEHVENPRELLKMAGLRLRAGGHLIVRVPAYDSWAAEHYGTDWIAWDPPRHLQLPTTRGLQIACESADLRLVRQFRDGSAFGFWGSEQCRLGIPLRSANSWAEDPSQSRFSKDQVDHWEHRARELNARGLGDTVTFVLERTRS